MLRAFGLNGKHSLAEVCCQTDDDDVVGDIYFVGRLELVWLGYGCCYRYRSSKVCPADVTPCPMQVRSPWIQLLQVR